MHRPGRWSAAALALIATCLWASPGGASDVDGGNDCPKVTVDRGDAPEGVQAYPGVLAAFPSCLSAGPVGTQSVACPPVSTPPGPAGFVAHVTVAGEDRYWLGCFAGQGGIDDEPDAKVNDSGGPLSACAPGLAIDCLESAFGLTFGQDECAGSNDAGLGAAASFTACSLSTITFSVWNCGPLPRTVRLNILVDWNQDGDWNDNVQCATGCAYEWSVKNAAITMAPGCTMLSSPAFIAGPAGGSGWMRITISNDPVGDDFPWAGSAGLPGQALFNGETEDYPVMIGHSGGGICPDRYEDWGDAPETAQAYSNGTTGAFPTCGAAGAVGTLDIACAPISSPPLAAGFVRHVAGPLDPKFWFGCGVAAAGTGGIDSETDGKMNASGAAASDCDPTVAVDGVEPAFGMSFGQDEWIADPDFDAGVRQPLVFTACTRESVEFFVYNCDSSEVVSAYLNVLVDMNQDADWNDNFTCGPQPGGACAYEWAVKNVLVQIPPGCTIMHSPLFLIGPNGGEGWMRLTLSLAAVGDDFPWNGSAASGALACGETEDYPVTITGADTCHIGYQDFGDAPENITAYTSGIAGAFPTCLYAGPVGTQTIACGVAQSTPPGAAGHVRHVALPTDAEHFWLGCAQAPSPLLAVDSETDGKVDVGGPFGGPGACDPAVNTDCIESLIGLGMNQDECVGDADAGIAAPTYFLSCSTGTVSLSAFNCTGRALPVYLNILVDWNHDGDWNDNASGCAPAACVPEWAVKNLSMALTPGCATYASPSFPTGQQEGRSWMRVTLSNEPAPDDFPWNGTAGMPAGQFFGGETEDYGINVVLNPVGVADPGLAVALWLGTPYPNPARGDVSIPFSLPRAGDVSLAVYDLAGRRLIQLRSGPAGAGFQRVLWDFRDGTGRNVAPGHYIVKLRTENGVLTRYLIRLE